MSSQEYYYTIEKKSVAEFKDRGSRFIAYAHPIIDAEDFKKILTAIKKEHPKAVHHCFAYRLGLTGDNFRANDDGEPSGAAGKPILGQIDSRHLTQVAIVVVRYFGGTLLGVPGLINAYKTSASLALQLIPAIKKTVEIVYEIQFDHTIINDIMRLLKQFSCTLLEKDIGLFCVIKASIPSRDVEIILTKIKEIPNTEAKKVV